jgi:dethiobiotin synthetase
VSESGTGAPDGCFVAGTGTGVGKTVVTAGLVAWLRDDSPGARAIKPAQTGAPEDDDAGYVAAACDDPDAAVALRRYGPALAPRVAAERTDRPLDYDSLRADCREAVEGTPGPAVVEGIGGVRVPLAGDREVIDLVADLDLPTVVVARSGLGTLNHTALTVEAFRRRDVEVSSVVFDEYRGETTAERTNPAEIERMTDLPVHTVPPLDGGPEAVAAGVRTALPASALPAAVRPK